MLNPIVVRLAAMFASTGHLYSLRQWKPERDSAPHSTATLPAEARHASARFVELCASKNPNLIPAEAADVLKEDAENDDVRKLVDIAGECVNGAAPDDRRAIRLRSPFAGIQFNKPSNARHYFMQAEKLSKREQAGFPKHMDAPHTNKAFEAYQNLTEDFLGELERIANERGLLALFNKYFHAVASGNDTISLALRSWLSAAISHCLWHEAYHGIWRENKQAKLDHPFDEATPAPCILIKGDMSGIQDFIFNVTTDKAAQKLKSRSFLVQLITEAVVQLIVDRLELPWSCVLLNTGGNFYILAPRSQECLLADCRRTIDEALLDTGLHLALGWSSVSVRELRYNVREVWNRAGRACQAAKLRKFQDMPWGQVYEPFSQNPLEADYSFLAKSLRDWSGYALYPSPRSSRIMQDLAKWERIIYRLGYRVSYDHSVPEVTVVFNKTDFTKTGTSFRFLVKDLPEWEEKPLKKYVEYHHKELSANKMDWEDLKTGRLIEFLHLGNMAGMETGSGNLGILKLDVDNLGLLFSKGLGEQAGISHITELAMRLQWFFEGHLTCLVKKQAYKNRIYTVYSGGDDVFLLGPWNSVFALAYELYDSFKRFVCHHRGITLSASLIVVTPKFSVSRFAQLAEDALGQSKRRCNSQYKPIKNSVTVFGETLSWECFSAARLIKENLVTLIKEHQVGRDILFKTTRLCKTLQSILQKVEPWRALPVWRFSYFLRDIIVANPVNEKERRRNAIARALNNEFEKIVLRAVNNSFDVSPILFAVAARWAELQTANVMTKQM